MRIKSIVVALCTVTVCMTATPKYSLAGSQSRPPAAPVFSITAPATKVGEGSYWSPGGRSVATDGANLVCAAFVTYEVGANIRSLRVAMSFDGGLIWGDSDIVASNPNISQFAGIAVSADPVYPGEQIVHVIWPEQDPSTHIITIYYSYNATQAPGWSTPVIVNGSATVGVRYGHALAVGKDGAIHIIFQGGPDTTSVYYTTSPAAGSFFTEPEALTTASNIRDEPTLAVDGSNNVFVAWPIYDGISSGTGINFSKKLAGSSQWSTPVTVAPAASAFISTSIAAFDANNIYIATYTQNTGLFVYTSTNGGSSWTRRTVTTTAPSLNSISVVVNPSKVLTVVAAFPAQVPWPGRVVRVFRSTDGGVTWSAPTQIIGTGEVNLAVGSSGKAMALTSSYPDKSIYFTKEK